MRHASKVGRMIAGWILPLLAGCAAGPIAFDEAPQAATSFTLIDVRPDEERHRELMSTNVTDCNYGIVRQADDRTSPDRISLLKLDLQSMAGSDLAGKTLTLRSYTVFVNQSTMFRGQMNSTLKGVIPRAMINIRCSKEKIKGGWYEPSEVTTSNSPVIADMVMDVDDHPYAIHVVRSPEDDVVLANKDPRWGAFLRDVLKIVSSQFVTAYRSRK